MQSVKVEEGIIKFENYFKQLPVSFKIYADFYCNLKDIEIFEGACTKKYDDHIPCSFSYKIVCVDDRFSKSVVVYREKNAAYEFIKAICKEHKYCKKIIKKHFHKNLVMTEQEKYFFNKLIVAGFVESLLIMTMKKWEDIAIQLVNLEEQRIGAVI